MICYIEVPFKAGLTVYKFNDIWFIIQESLALTCSDCLIKRTQTLYVENVLHLGFEICLFFCEVQRV